MHFIGKFHPLLVHLPIGFLLIGLILYGWQLWDKRKDFSNVLAPIFLMGAIAATLSCATGLLLMNDGDYDVDALDRHKYAGISLAVISFYVWYLCKRSSATINKHFFTVGLFFLIMITGHYGGTLTHGSGFLRFNPKIETEVAEIKNIENAVVFKDLIQPILTNKCVSCHGPEKMKGNLRLDNVSYVQKGGKTGNLITPPDPLILKRILLSPEDEHHMPPKEKGQLTQEEFQLIKWWIDQGASFSASVAQLKKDSIITTILNKKRTNPTAVSTEETWPIVDAADPNILKKLRTAGASISPISAESNLLNVNLLNVKDSSIQFWETLALISPQLIRLKADLPFITNDHLKFLVNSKNLQKLSLIGTKINDDAFSIIKQLTSLQSLNLSNTSVSSKGLETLRFNKNLRYLYALDLKDSLQLVTLDHVEILRHKFQVPTLESDTTTVKELKH